MRGMRGCLGDSVLTNTFGETAMRCELPSIPRHVLENFLVNVYNSVTITRFAGRYLLKERRRDTRRRHESVKYKLGAIQPRTTRLFRIF